MGELATNRPAQAFWPGVIEALPGVIDYRCGTTDEGDAWQEFTLNSTA